MITITQHKNLLTVSIFNQFNLADCKALEDHIVYFEQNDQTGSSLNILIDFTDMVDYTIDAALEELTFAKDHAGVIHKIALISDNAWLSWVVSLGNLFTDYNAQAFSSEQEAKTWLFA